MALQTVIGLSKGMSALAIAIGVPYLAYSLSESNQRRHFPTSMELRTYVHQCLDGKLYERMPLEQMRSEIRDCAEHGEGPGSFWEKYTLIRRIAQEYEDQFRPTMQQRQHPYIRSSPPFQG